MGKASSQSSLIIIRYRASFSSSFANFANFPDSNPNTVAVSAVNPSLHYVNGLRWYLEIIDRNGENANLAKTGKISIVAIDEDGATGIANIENEADNRIVSIFDANGRKMNGFQKGLNIVKYSDGTTKKIMK